MTRRSRNGVIAAGTLAAVALVAPATAALAAPADATALAPLQATEAPNAIEGSYIVVLKDQALEPGVRSQEAATAAAVTKARGKGIKIKHQYTSALRGYAATMSDEQLAEVRKDPAVAYVEADQTMTVSATQNNATWGLDRIDQRNLPLSTTYTYNVTGSGVRAFIIDTGVLTTHSQFSGRTASGYSAISDGRGTTDCNGHGTHVAGTVGGSTHGVAKGVTIVPVRVLDCNGSGSNSGVIAGMDWVAANKGSGPAVANMSLGGGASTATDSAVARMTSAGVTVVVAAGNENQNACNVSPARAPSAITVGSTTNTDARSSFSNFGSCLDVFAPGSNITSAWHTSTSATNTISGTSMASPHGAGVAALYLQSNTSASPAAVSNAITGNATTGVVSGAGTSSPNRLLYSLFGGSTPPPTTPPPTTPPPSGDCASSVTGSLSGRGDADLYQYTAGATGRHTGCLTGPSGTDFDLYLQKLSGSTWTTVARGISTGSTENVTYSGTAGTYRWRVYSYSGSGSYTLSTGRP